MTQGYAPFMSLTGLSQRAYAYSLKRPKISGNKKQWHTNLHKNSWDIMSHNVFTAVVPPWPIPHFLTFTFKSEETTSLLLFKFWLKATFLHSKKAGWWQFGRLACGSCYCTVLLCELTLLKTTHSMVLDRSALNKYCKQAKQLLIVLSHVC